MKFSFLQWNIWYEEDIHNIAKYLKKNPADIIALQELTTNYPEQTERNTPRYVAEQLGYNYCLGGEESFNAENNDRGFGNAIFSKYPIVSHRIVWINEPTGSGGFDDQYRTYLEAVLDINGIQVVVATTHMSYTHEFKVTDRKREETDKLLKELKKNTTHPFIFSGDLNAVPGSYTISQISSLLEPVDQDLSEKTWTTKPFSYQGFEETELNWRLDYVFTSKAIKTVSSEIEQNEFFDHLPIRAEFEI